ncbi:putative cell wall glucanase protein [Neofusicoccum parvum]|nr:putative cell wall glucanase protein [Neofusicoccum parvum]
MKTGLFIQVALAILFGLVAGLPQCKFPRSFFWQDSYILTQSIVSRHVLEERAIVTITDVVTVTVPAVIVHIQGTRTWTEIHSIPSAAPTVPSEPKITSATPIQVSETSYQSNPIMVSEPGTLPPSHQTEAPSTEESAPSSTDDPIVVSSSITYIALSASEDSASSSKYEPIVASSSITYHAPKPATETVALSSRAYSEPSYPVPTPAGASDKHGNGYGIGYNAYNADHSCKDPGQVAHDIDSVSDYGMIRLYGTDCGQLDSVMTAVKKYPGMKLFLGIWHCETTDAALNEASAIIDAVNKNLDGDWGLIHTVSVGNEVIDRGEATVDGLLDTLNAVKAKLKPYGVPVVTVETPGVFEGEGKALCQASDYVAINAHPFFDKSGSWNDPTDAGKFVKLMSHLTKSCGKDRTVITESGWPHGSDLPMDYFTSKNLPVPSVQNHVMAVQALKDAYVGREDDLIVFSAFNDLWKTDTDQTMGVEHYWGIV